jgi:hypothetical protein
MLHHSIIRAAMQCNLPAVTGRAIMRLKIQSIVIMRYLRAFTTIGLGAADLPICTPLFAIGMARRSPLSPLLQFRAIPLFSDGV